MARARNIKPGFFLNEKLAECEPLARLFFSGLWCHADREGRLEDRPKRLKMAILPYDDCNIENLLTQLSNAKFIIRYKAENEQFIQIVNFVKHQQPHHMECPSEIPPAPGHENRFNHTPISPKQRARIYARDKHQCVICGAREKLQIDHIVMVAYGGTSDDDNLRTLCSQCNNKRSKSPVNSLNPLTDSLNPHPPSPRPMTDVDDKNTKNSVIFSPSIRVLDAMGVRNDPNWHGDGGRVRAWINDGADLELDILPTIKRIMEKRNGQEPPRSLKYFDQAIADAKATRLNPLPPGTPRGNGNGHATGPATAVAKGFADVLAEMQPDSGTNQPSPIVLLAGK